MIRQANENDIHRLASLIGELGYPTSNDEMAQRFPEISADTSYNTLVIEKDGIIVGMIGMMLGLAYENNNNYVRIIALVVDSTYRKRGIGEELISAAEKWAREKGATKLALNSGNRDERNDAHRFYTRLGFTGSATGYNKKF